MRNGQSIYLREQPFGGNELTQEIQNKFGLAPEEAEVAKRDGGLPEEYETELLQPFVDKMGLEIARALHFFFSSTPYNQVAPDRALGRLRGDSRRRRGDHPPHAGPDRHRESVRQHGRVAQDQGEEPRAGRALAHGRVRSRHAEVRSVIRVNLLPHREMRRRRQQKQFLITLGVVVALGAAIWLAGAHLAQRARYEDQISRNKYLEDEIAKLDKEIEDIKKLKEMTAALLARKKVVETLQSNRAEVVHLLDELARQLPEGIYLKGIKQAGNRVTINGFTQSQARVSTLMRNLEASPHLENANLVEIKAVTTPGSRVNEFTLNVSLARAEGRARERRQAGAKPAAAK